MLHSTFFVLYVKNNLLGNLKQISLNIISLHFIITVLMICIIDAISFINMI